VNAPTDGAWVGIVALLEAIRKRDLTMATTLLSELPSPQDEVQSFALTLANLRIATMSGEVQQGQRYAAELRAHSCMSDAHAQAVAIHRIGAFERVIGNLEQAMSLQLESASVFNSIGWEFEAALCTAEIGAIQMSKGDVAGATYSYLSIVDVMKEHANETQFAALMVNLGVALQRSGNMHAAEQRYKEALLVSPFANKGLERATVLQNMAVISKLDSRFEEAQHRYEEALACVTSAIVPNQKVRILNGLADLALRKSDIQGAREYVLSVTDAELAQTNAIVRTEADALRAQIAARMGGVEEATLILNVARKRARENGLLDERFELLREALVWVSDPAYRLEILEELQEVTEERLKAVTVSVESVMNLRTRYEQEKAHREIERQQEIIRTIIDTQTETMNSIGRELHDSLGQDLTVLSKLAQRLSTDVLNEEDRERVVHTLIEVSERSTLDARRIAHLMAGHGITGEGLPRALEHLRTDVATSNPALSMEVMAIGDVQSISNDVARALYRILQTLVQNVLHHADANTCAVQLFVDDEGIRLTIEDNGKGFDVNTVARGMGMKEMMVRAELVGAAVNVDSIPGHGTFVSISIPTQKN